MNVNQNDLELQISVEVRQPHFGGNGIRIQESVTLQPKNFLDLCKILSRFHELAQELRSEK